MVGWPAGIQRFTQEKAQANMNRNALAGFVIGCTLLTVLCCSPDRGRKQTLTVVGTTTHIETIVRAVAAEGVDVVALVAGGMCPGHFDISPSHVRMLERADLLIMHGWEKWAAEVVEAAGNSELEVVRLRTAGNAMLPEVHMSMTAEIAGILCARDSGRCAGYMHNANAYRGLVLDTAEAARRMAQPLRGTPVVCAEHQKALVTWLGCTAVAGYGRPEDMTPVELGRLERDARAAGVALVVDNMQSGPRAGQSLAADIGAKHVALSNFPVGGSYVHTLMENVRALVACLENDE